MKRIVALSTMGILLMASVALAEPTRFKFTKNQTLAYTIQQTTKVNETIIDEKTSKPVDQEIMTKHTVVRQWKVVDVDEKGIATLEMTIRSMKWEQKLPNGESDVFDSSKPDPMAKDNMSEFVGPILAVVRVDPTGTVTEVKQFKHTTRQRLMTELPFKIMLPPAGPAVGLAWDRNFQIKLDPPQGAGESYEATQKFAAKAAANNFMTVGITTSIKEPPAQTADQIPLLPMMLEGNAYFNLATGQYHGARLGLKKELLNHQGEGTKYSFESVYLEDLKQEK